MHRYEVFIPMSGDYFCDKELDIDELGSYVTVGVRNDWDSYEHKDYYLFYVDIMMNQPYLAHRIPRDEIECPVVLTDEENQIEFAISIVY